MRFEDIAIIEQMCIVDLRKWYIHENILGKADRKCAVRMGTAPAEGNASLQ